MGCVSPFTTASYKWNVKYDKNKLAFKKNFLRKGLPPYAGDRPPNILLIVMDDLGIQYLNLLVLFDYNYSLNRFFAEDAGTYGVNVKSHLQIFALKVGMQF